jgi:hypothetical protein
MTFEENIKNWVSIDNQLKILNHKTKHLRIDRNDLMDSIIEYVDTNSLSNATIKISDGKLRFANTKQTAPLTLKFIEQCLGECVGNEEQVLQIMNYIKEKRDIKYLPDIKRYYAKND